MRGALLALLLTTSAPAQIPTAAENEQIHARLRELTQAISRLRLDDARLADIEIYEKAATWILRFEDEFYAPAYVADTLQAIEHGLVRAADSKFSWESNKGSLVRAYRSRIDGSIQPYALVIPDSYDGSKSVQLNVVLHDRNDQLNEIRFLAEHETGAPTPAGQEFIQLEVFGRGNNGYRWAGETDVFEAIDSVRARYRIDDRRIVLQGSGMGGAGALHLALHYPDRWAAVHAAPRRYPKLSALAPYQEATFRIYDPAGYAENSAMVQMHPPGATPDHVHFVTYTTAYHRCYWLSVEGMQRPYERAEVDGDRNGDEVRVTTTNVSRLKIDGATRAVIDGQSIDLPGFGVLVNTVNGWRNGGGIARSKKPGLQGPIDDAFREPFLCVRPTGRPHNKEAGEFERQTLEQFGQEFAKWMRGEIRMKDDKEVTDDDIARFHLVLFGDPSSNRLVKRVIEKMRREWPDGPIVPMLIAPNPLNSQRYVVLNSGHTFHEDEFKTSEALLYPRLGDFAIVDARARQVIRGGVYDSDWRQLIRFRSQK